jgi:hypothetical protein
VLPIFNITFNTSINNTIDSKSVVSKTDEKLSAHFDGVGGVAAVKQNSKKKIIDCHLKL